MALDINNLDLFLGKRIRSFRGKMHWPLKTLAIKLGISIQQLHRYETGANKITASLLYTIAEEFKTDVVCFYEGYQEQLHHSSSSLHPHNNILLIEENNNDEILFRQALMEFPEKLNVFSCHNGEEAINYFRNLENDSMSFSQKPDLVFLDLNLPIISGFEVLKDIKHRQSLQNTPVVVFTRSTKDEDMNKSYSLHASGFINKSFSYNEIKQQLHKTLSYWIDTVQLPN